jgi:hypothetical protein
VEHRTLSATAAGAAAGPLIVFCITAANTFIAILLLLPLLLLFTDASITLLLLAAAAATPPELTPTPPYSAAVAAVVHCCCCWQCCLVLLIKQQPLCNWPPAVSVISSVPALGAAVSDASIGSDIFPAIGNMQSTNCLLTSGCGQCLLMRCVAGLRCHLDDEAGGCMHIMYLLMYCWRSWFSFNTRWNSIQCMQCSCAEGNRCCEYP